MQAAELLSSETPAHPSEPAIHLPIYPCLDSVLSFCIFNWTRQWSSTSKPVTKPPSLVSSIQLGWFALHLINIGCICISFSPLLTSLALCHDPLALSFVTYIYRYVKIYYCVLCALRINITNLDWNKRIYVHLSRVIKKSNAIWQMSGIETAIPCELVVIQQTLTLCKVTNMFV